VVASRPLPYPPATTVTVVVMGVSGSGKSTVGAELAARLGWRFADGDDFMPAANVEKMHSGHPLTDDDRRPWLDTLARWVGEREAAGDDTVLACSALRRRYRDRLRSGHPSVVFCDLDVDRTVLDRRLRNRTGHFMPASLLASQLATLEPLQPDEPGVVVHVSDPPGDVAAEVIAALTLPGARPQQ
jgi:gluconokinase